MGAISEMKEMYLTAATVFKGRKGFNVYPLPENEVCAFDIPINDEVYIHINREWVDFDKPYMYRLRIRIDTSKIYDLRLNLGCDKLYTKVEIENLMAVMRMLNEGSLNSSPEEK